MTVKPSRWATPRPLIPAMASRMRLFAPRTFFAALACARDAPSPARAPPPTASDAFRNPRRLKRDMKIPPPFDRPDWSWELFALDPYDFSIARDLPPIIHG